MKSGIPPKSFLYTAAPFGHDGINGFQFVGLPESGAAPELIEAVAEHVRYSAPLGAPSQPTSEEIARSFPVSTRIVTGAPGGHTILLQSRYIGQVYQSNGKRGKWGNFIAHARVVPDDWETVAAIVNLARTADWRDGLTSEELATARPLDLPNESLVLPEKLNSDPFDERDQAAGFAAILARLDGDLPLLFPNTEPEHALAMFQVLAANLPEKLARRLSWSSFEFDAGPGYDVLATIGDTRLTADADAYLRLDAPPGNPIYLWAGENICRDATTFWERLSLFSDLSDTTRLAEDISLLRRIHEAESSQLDPICEALALVRKGPVDPKRVDAAEAIFIGSFGVLGGVEADNFALLVDGAKEAQALSKWSGSDKPWKELVGWAEAFPSIKAALEAAGSSEPLSTAISVAVSAGVDLDYVLDMTMAAVERELTLGTDPMALSTAILNVLPDGGESEQAARTILRLANHHLKSTGHAVLIQDVLKTSGQSAGFDWLNIVMSKLPTVAPDLAESVLPDIELGILENLAIKNKNIGDLSQRILELAPAQFDKARNERLEKLLERLDATLPHTGRQQAKTAVSLVKAAKAHRIDLGAAPNSLALQTVVSKELLIEVLKDGHLFTSIQRTSAPKVYVAFFERAFAQLELKTMQGSAKKLKYLWRGDIRDHFVKHAVQHFLSVAKRSTAVDFLDDAIMAHGANKGGDQREDDWALVCRTVAVTLGLKIDQRSFDEIVRDFPKSRLVDEIARRRNRGIKGVSRSVGKALRSLSSWRRGD